MTIGYLPVAGTWGAQRPGVQWFELGSPFARFMDGLGFVNLCANAVTPYDWSTDLDFTQGDHYDWKAGGQALFYYVVPQFNPKSRPFPPSETVVITHSHGLQVGAYAAAMGLKIDRFLDIAGPVRKDMTAIYEKARPNIRRWMHVHSDWTDYVQLAGELFAGNWPVRKHPLADINVAVPGVGHSGLLYNDQDFPLWQTKGLVAFLQPAPVVEAA